VASGGFGRGAFWLARGRRTAVDGGILRPRLPYPPPPCYPLPHTIHGGRPAAVALCGRRLHRRGHGRRNHGVASAAARWGDAATVVQRFNGQLGSAHARAGRDGTVLTPDGRHARCHQGRRRRRVPPPDGPPATRGGQRRVWWWQAAFPPPRLPWSRRRWRRRRLRRAAVPFRGCSTVGDDGGGGGCGQQHRQPPPWRAHAGGRRAKTGVSVAPLPRHGGAVGKIGRCGAGAGAAAAAAAVMAGAARPRAVAPPLAGDHDAWRSFPGGDRWRPSRRLYPSRWAACYVTWVRRSSGGWGRGGGSTAPPLRRFRTGTSRLGCVCAPHDQPVGLVHRASGRAGGWWYASAPPAGGWRAAGSRVGRCVASPRRPPSVSVSVCDCSAGHRRAGHVWRAGILPGVRHPSERVAKKCGGGGGSTAAARCTCGPAAGRAGEKVGDVGGVAPRRGGTRRWSGWGSCPVAWLAAWAQTTVVA